MSKQTATREQAEAIAREVWGYNDPDAWNPYGCNTVSLWQSGEHDQYTTGHWYINRRYAYGDTIFIRMGRTVKQLEAHKAKIEKNIQEHAPVDPTNYKFNTKQS